jgi:UDP-N-acetylmuramate--alanine ligase
VILADIYPAREKPIEGVDSGLLMQKILEVEPEKQVEWLRDRGEILERLRAESRPGDLVMTMGAGDIRELGEQFVDELQK